MCIPRCVDAPLAGGIYSQPNELSSLHIEEDVPISASQLHYRRLLRDEASMSILASRPLSVGPVWQVHYIFASPWAPIHCMARVKNVCHVTWLNSRAPGKEGGGGVERELLA